MQTIFKTQTILKTQNQLKLWLISARPKMVTAPLSPLLMGSAAAVSSGASFDLSTFFFCFGASLALLVAVNFFNDASQTDARDAKERLGPIRPIHLGLLQPEELFRAAWLTIAIGWLFALPLIFIGGWPIAALFALSCCATYSHSHGPYPLTNTLFCNLAIWLFFGIVATMSIAYLQSGRWLFSAFLAANQVGIMCCGKNIVNNLRDIEEDKKNGRHTTPLRFGMRAAHTEFALALFAPFILNLLWLGLARPYVALLPLLLLPFAFAIWRGIRANQPGSIYNRFFIQTALLELFFSLSVSTLLFLDRG